MRCRTEKKQYGCFCSQSRRAICQNHNHDVRTAATSDGSPKCQVFAKAVVFSFSGDPAYEGTIAEDGNTIDRRWQHCNFEMEAIKALVRARANVAQNLPITGDWNGILDLNAKRSNFVLHIQE
jgi:hypothetical protein